MDAFETDYLQRARDLEHFRGLIRAKRERVGVMAPFAGSGIALLRGTIKLEDKPLVHLGAGFYYQAKSDEDALVVLERILQRKFVEWAVFIEEQGTAADVRRFQDRFASAATPPAPQLAEAEPLFFEPSEEE